MRYLIYDNIQRAGGLAHTFVTYNAALDLARKNNLILVMDYCISSFEGNTPGTFEKFFGIEDTHQLREDLLSRDDVIAIPNSKHTGHYHSFADKYKDAKSIILHVKFDPNTVGYNSLVDLTSNLPEIRRNYQKADNNSQYPGKLKEGYTNIGIHMRRGNVLSHKNLNHILCKDQAYIDKLNQLLPDIDGPYWVHIYTQSVDGKFRDETNSPCNILEKFDTDNVSLHMDFCPLTSFNDLVNCDHVIRGYSGFSELACKISGKPTHYVKNLGGY